MSSYNENTLLMKVNKKAQKLVEIWKYVIYILKRFSKSNVLVFQPMRFETHFV